jgi:hypothetical protein
MIDEITQAITYVFQNGIFLKMHGQVWESHPNMGGGDFHGSRIEVRKWEEIFPSPKPSSTS